MNMLDEEREHLYLTFQSTLLEMQHTVPPVAYYHCFYFSGFFHNKKSVIQSSLLQKHLVKLVKQVQIVAGTTVEIFTVKLTWLQVLFQS